jgi:hypothetical protein
LKGRWPEALPLRADPTPHCPTHAARSLNQIDNFADNF